MRQKSDIELQRQRISLMVRAQASIVRAEFINATLPDALAAFDAAVQQGGLVEVTPVDLTEVVNAAVKEIASVSAV